MGARGTDVARESAGMILTDDNFATIVAAVEEGRRIYDNLRKAVRYFTSAKLSTLLTALFATALGVPMPLLPLYIIWLELLVDPTSSVVFEVQRAEPMNRPSGAVWGRVCWCGGSRRSPGRSASTSTRWP